MDQDQLEAYLRLYHSPALGIDTLSRLLAEFGEIAPICNLGRAELTAAGLSNRHIELLIRARGDATVSKSVAADMQWSCGNRHSIVLFESPSYPDRLRQIAGAPPLLYAIGDPAHLQADLIAIVGSRRASNRGLQNAYWLAQELATAGLHVCSGLALGIDTRAHAGALAVGAGTVAVMATGADGLYPKENDKLSKQIIENGVLVTEFPLGMPPMAQNFPRRNRIISGLSLGTLVVEATPKSGSLITARFAMEQNRETFAVPGPIHGQGSRGCHQLLKQGAKLVEEAEDVLSELKLLVNRETARKAKQLPQKPDAVAGNLQQCILETLEPDGCLIDNLLERTGVDLQQLTSQLLELELSGEIESIGGRYVRISQTGIFQSGDEPEGAG